MASLKGQTIAASFQDLVKRADTYSQTGTNVELMNDSGVVQPTGLYLESGATTDNVGIGEAAPAAELQVKVTASSSGHTANCLRITSEAASAGNSLLMGVNDSGTVYSWIDSKDVGTGALAMVINEGGGTIYMGGAFGANTGMTIDANSRISLSNNDGGTSNTVFGKLAGNLIASGDNYNVFIGENVADADMTNATWNTAVGYTALSGLTTGAYNVCVGGSAGTGITTGASNVCIGLSALSTATTEQSNTAIGTNAMSGVRNDGSDSNVAIGNASLQGGTGVLVGNVAIGDAALNSTDDQAQTGTIAIGQSALTALTSGAGNLAIGYQAMSTINDDDDNVSIGYQSSNYMWGGSNVAVGKDALLGATFTEGGGVYNNDPTITHTADARIIAGLGVSGTGIPDGAYISSITDGTHFELSASTTGGSLSGQTLTFYSRTTGTVAIGKDALNALTSGVSNTVVGYQAGDALTTGYENTVLGKSALGADVGGSRSVAIGINALENQTGVTGLQKNTAVGSYSGRYLSTGVENTFIGYYAGYGAIGTPTEGSYNTVVGSEAGGALEGAGAGNTLIGRAAGSTITTGTSNIIIGSGIAPSSITGTNQIAIGGTGQADNSVTLGNSSVTAVYIPNESMITSQSTTSMADDATISLFAEAGAAMVYVYDSFSGEGGAFFCTYTDEVVKVAGSANTENSNSDGSLCVYKSESSHTVTVKNRLGGTKSIAILVMSARAS